MRVANQTTARYSPRLYRTTDPTHAAAKVAAAMAGVTLSVWVEDALRLRLREQFPQALVGVEQDRTCG